MNRSERVTFDESLPKLVAAIAENLGQEELEQGLILRDSSGRLTFFSSSDSPDATRHGELEIRLSGSIGAYAREDGVIGFRNEPGVQRLLDDAAAFPMQQDRFRFRLLDRRIVGSAWIEAPADSAPTPPRIVFASLKGGVGRSTALSVAASDLARRHKDVLIIDLDLEAPGVGGMLLDGARMPPFGAVDFLVENGLAAINDRHLDDYLGTSALTEPGGGRVDVVPALGRSATEHPGNTLAKISRAMIEDISHDGASISVPEQIRKMVDRFATRSRYDVVLIDSRAGLSELAAPAIIGLGATVLCFGTAQTQTVQGYAALFAAIKLLAQRDLDAGSKAEWRDLFKAVLTKVGPNPVLADWYRDEMYEIFADNLYDEEQPQSADTFGLSFSLNDPEAPHWPLIVPFDSNFIAFDPIREPSQLTAPFYERTYRPFLDGLDTLIFSAEVSSGGTGREQ